MVVADAVSYLTDPLVILGFVLLLAFLATRQLQRSDVIASLPDSFGFRLLKLALNRGFVLGLIVMSIGIYLKAQEPQSITTAGRGEGAPRQAGEGPGEVDFGFVELDPGMATPVPSYKNGGTMVVYAGEYFAYHAFADGEVPPIELRAGDNVQLLQGSDGKVKIDGPPNLPLPAVLLVRGPRRESLPGGAPQRISVKVQVFGADRPN